MFAPIDLKEFYIKKINIEHVDGEKTKTSKMGIDFSFSLAEHAENVNLFRLELKVKTGPVDKTEGIKLETCIVGFFQIDENIKEEAKRQYYMMVNGSTILYGILRGQVSLISSSLPQGKFILPTVSMQDEVKKFFDAESKKREAKSKSKKCLPKIDEK